MQHRRVVPRELISARICGTDQHTWTLMVIFGTRAEVGCMRGPINSLLCFLTTFALVFATALSSHLHVPSGHSGSRGFGRLRRLFRIFRRATQVQFEVVVPTSGCEEIHHSMRDVITPSKQPVRATGAARGAFPRCFFASGQRFHPVSLPRCERAYAGIFASCFQK